MSETLLALFCAILVNCGATLFEPGVGSEMSPYISSIIFTLSVLIFISKLKNLSKMLHPYGPFKPIFQFFLYMLILELSLKLCWFPMEKSIMELPNKSSYGIDYVSKLLSIRFRFLNSFQSALKAKGAKISVSYFLSLFILMATAQFVRILDVNLIIRQGFKCFLSDIMQRNFCIESVCEVPTRRKRSRTTRAYSRITDCCDDDCDFD